MYKVLFVEDNEMIREGMTDFFGSRDRIQLYTAVDGNDGLDKILNGEYDLYLLDIMMPGLDGFELCKIIRKRGDSPVVFLTGKVREADALYGYELGADDYIVKPFSANILYSKLLALLERTASDRPEKKVIASGNIQLDPVKLTIKIDGEEVEVPGKEFALLKYLMEHPEVPVKRSVLFDAVWNNDPEIAERVVDNRIKNLRKLLKSESKRIKTVYGIGYRFE